MDRRGDDSTYQPPRIRSSLQGDSSLGRPHSDGVVRQFHGSFLLKQTGRDQVALSLLHYMGFAIEMRRPGHPATSLSLFRKENVVAEALSRGFFRQQRMEAVSSMDQTHLQSPREISSGHVCSGGGHSTTDVLLQKSSPSNLKVRCLRGLLDRFVVVRLPSMVPDLQGAPDLQRYRS